MLNHARPLNPAVRLQNSFSAVGSTHVLKPKRHIDVARDLIGETPIGVVGALLQWLTLAILISLALWTNSLAPRSVIALALVGVSSLIAGIALSIRGDSLGPIVVMPGVIGIVILVIVTALLYPIRWIMNESTDNDPPDQ
ncbi:MAG: hypothetical protein KF752_20965 [Pirellulaceae bacterium]|nr:hypothetical protein [Pirellulaceae bacterium]